MSAMPTDLLRGASRSGNPRAVSAPTSRTRPGVLERLTEILEVFDGAYDGLWLDDVSAATGLPRSTAFRLLSQMVDLGWLSHDSSGYRLGPRALQIGRRGNDHSRLRAAAAVHLNDLHLRTGGVTHLTVLEGAETHCLDKVGGTALNTVPSAVGLRTPADRIPSGRVLLAGAAAEQVDQLFAGRPGRPGQPDLLRLHAHLVRIRRQHGVDQIPGSECSLGLTTVAAPVLGPLRPIAAVSVVVRNGAHVHQLTPLVLATARQISAVLLAPA